MTKWQCQSLFNRKPVTKTASDCFVPQSCSLSPFHQCQCFIVEGQQMISAHISHLLLHCRPAAVAGFVSLVVVLAVNGHSLWAFSHVRKEVSEVPPAVADGYATSSVAFPVLVIGVRASIDHRRPYSIRPRVGTTPTLMSMLREPLCGSLVLVAPTRHRQPAAKIAALHWTFDSAVASTEPRMSTSADKGNYGPSPKPPAGQINNPRHCCTPAKDDAPLKNGVRRPMVQSVFGSYPSRTPRIIADSWRGGNA